MIRSKSQKSDGAKSGEYGGWRIILDLEKKIENLFGLDFIKKSKFS
jgi:hypothetical protein